MKLLTFALLATIASTAVAADHSGCVRLVKPVVTAKARPVLLASFRPLQDFQPENLIRRLLQSSTSENAQCAHNKKVWEWKE